MRPCNEHVELSSVSASCVPADGSQVRLISYQSVNKYSTLNEMFIGYFFDPKNIVLYNDHTFFLG